MRTPYVLIVIVAAGMLTASAPGQAIYIETPLNIRTGPSELEAGDEAEFVIGPNPNNDSAEADWAGKTVKVRFSYDPNEGEAGDPDAPVSNDGYTEGDITEITLDDKATGSFTWTVPAEVDDRNVQVFLEDASGARLAFHHIAVGDAEPQLHAMSGPSDGQPEIDPETRDLQEDAVEGEEAPGIGAIGLLAALGVAGLALLRRRI